MRTPLWTFQAKSARSNRAARSRLRAAWIRCPRFPAVSIGTEKSKLNKYGLGKPGVTLRLGFGRAPAVTIAACASSTRALAPSREGLRYKAARESVPRFQVFGGHGVTTRPTFFSTNACKPWSPRLRVSSLEAVSVGTMGTGWYRRAVHPDKLKAAKRWRPIFRIVYINLLRTNKDREMVRWP